MAAPAGAGVAASGANAVAAVSGKVDDEGDGDGRAAVTGAALGDDGVFVVGPAAWDGATLRCGDEAGVEHTCAKVVAAGGLPKPFE